ncbi:hypothetical protein AWZ03_009585 [Drosophila navojoa]|uniref:Uncharacterized protein n=1 Tax=Drosophila navojoa TaxID=7232 RepID=A0A484B5G3_DRONA|nr:hypothetical protein AWZ03_009585 [Drosophila navojoa]
MIDQSNRAVYTPHPGPSGYGHDAMGYMMDSQAHMMHRPPGDPGFHQGYPHYPPAEYYGQHLSGGSGGGSGSGSSSSSGSSNDSGSGGQWLSVPHPQQHQQQQQQQLQQQQKQQF